MKGTKLFSTFRTQSTPDFSVRNTMVCETRRVCNLKISPQLLTGNFLLPYSTPQNMHYSFNLGSVSLFLILILDVFKLR
jgi:hypothetical protein